MKYGYRHEIQICQRHVGMTNFKKVRHKNMETRRHKYIRIYTYDIYNAHQN